MACTSIPCGIPYFEVAEFYSINRYIKDSSLHSSYINYWKTELQDLQRNTTNLNLIFRLEYHIYLKKSTFHSSDNMFLP
jgi:hypothetical protein